MIKFCEIRIKVSSLLILSLKFFDLRKVVFDFPFKNTSVHLASSQEELTVRTEKTIRNREKVVTVALVVTLTSNIWIIKESDSS